MFDQIDKRGISLFSRGKQRNIIAVAHGEDTADTLRNEPLLGVFNVKLKVGLIFYHAL